MSNWVIKLKGFINSNYWKGNNIIRKWNETRSYNLNNMLTDYHYKYMYKYRCFCLFKIPIYYYIQLKCVHVYNNPEITMMTLYIYYNVMS